MTPAEKTLAAMLVAFDNWEPDGELRLDISETLYRFESAGMAAGFIARDGSLLPNGLALVARYRAHLAAQLCTCGEARGEHDNGGACGAFKAAP